MSAQTVGVAGSCSKPNEFCYFPEHCYFHFNTAALMNTDYLAVRYVEVQTEQNFTACLRPAAGPGPRFGLGCKESQTGGTKMLKGKVPVTRIKNNAVLPCCG